MTPEEAVAELVDHEMLSEALNAQGMRIVNELFDAVQADETRRCAAMALRAGYWCLQNDILTTGGLEAVE